MTSNSRNVTPVSDLELKVLQLQKTEDYLIKQVQQLSDDMERFVLHFPGATIKEQSLLCLTRSGRALLSRVAHCRWYRCCCCGRYRGQHQIPGLFGGSAKSRNVLMESCLYRRSHCL